VCCTDRAQRRWQVNLFQSPGCCLPTTEGDVSLAQEPRQDLHEHVQGKEGAHRGCEYPTVNVSILNPRVYSVDEVFGVFVCVCVCCPVHMCMFVCMCAVVEYIRHEIITMGT